jgi:hypothetical protein
MIPPGRRSQDEGEFHQPSLSCRRRVGLIEQPHQCAKMRVHLAQLARGQHSLRSRRPKISVSAVDDSDIGTIGSDKASPGARQHRSNELSHWCLGLRLPRLVSQPHRPAGDIVKRRWTSAGRCPVAANEKAEPFELLDVKVKSVGCAAERSRERCDGHGADGRHCINELLPNWRSQGPNLSEISDYVGSVSANALALSV